MNDRKTLVINTVNETAYRKAAAAGKISDRELYIVDDDTKGRTVVASYDVVNLKQRQAVLSSAARLSLTGNEIVLTQGGRKASSVNVTDFLKDAVLSAVDVRLENEKLKFRFTIKDAQT